jgi:hypothetical protein
MTMGRFVYAVLLATPLGLASSIAACSSSKNPAAPPSGEDSGAAQDAAAVPAGDSATPVGDSASADVARVEGSPGTDAGAVGSAVVFCGTTQAPVEYDAASYEAGTSSSIEDGGGPPDSGLTSLPGPAPAACSGTGTPAAATLTVTNEATCSLELWWVDFSCSELFYQYVPPNGASVTQGTFVTHTWRLRAAGTHELLRDIPPLTGTTLAITYP